MEKFCLKWNDFESNVRVYFRKLREKEGLFDVTLATEDGQEIKAHKIILSAGSDFFSGLFLRNNQLEISRKNFYPSNISVNALSLVINSNCKSWIFTILITTKGKVHLESTANTKNEKYTRRITDAKGINSS